MATDLKARFDALSPNGKRVVMVGGAMAILLFVSWITTLFEEEKPALDRLETDLDIEMMLPERRDATLDELNASQIAASRRITRMEQNFLTSQKAIQDALRDLQAQLDTDREPAAIKKMQDQLDYLTRQLRRVETKATRTDRQLDEMTPPEAVVPEMVGPEEVPGDAAAPRVRPMPSIVGAPAGQPQEDRPPDIPDIPQLPQGVGQAAPGGEKPKLPDLPKLPEIPSLGGTGEAQEAPQAAAAERRKMRMVSAGGAQTAGRGRGFAEAESDEKRIPPSTVTGVDDGGVRSTQDDLAQSARTGGGGRTDRERFDREEERRSAKNVKVYMPAGSMFSGVLLNGVDALTSDAASSSPAPVLIRVKREAIVPNHFVVDIRECFVIASGFGRMSTERMEARTERLSCVRTDGGVIDTKLEGYIIGEDGKVGLRGRLVSRYGALLGRSAIAGLLSGFSDALKPEFVNQLQIDPTGEKMTSQASVGDVMEGGAYGGIADTSKEISGFFLDMARETLPTLEVDAGRKATIVILKGTDLELG